MGVDGLRRRRRVGGDDPRSLDGPTPIAADLAAADVAGADELAELIDQARRAEPAALVAD